jgi:GTP-binding protein YchF
MALQCGIIGIANSGKTTLFNCISSKRAETTHFAFSTDKSNIGRIAVPDERLSELEKLYTTEKITPTTVDIIDIPGLTKGSSEGEGIGNKFLRDIRNTDALIHVIRCFDDAALPHIDGSVDPVRDKETIELELQIKDIESIEKRKLKLETVAKSGDKSAKKKIDILNIFKEHIENFGTARTVPLNEEDKKIIDDLFLLTAKQVLYVCNVDAASAIEGNEHVEQLKKAVEDEQSEVLVIAAEMEADIAELEDSDDRMEFLADIGLIEPSVNKLVRSAYSLLDLLTFFTMAPKEIKAWTIKKGINAHHAAGIVHSDMARGFIRAEVMKYDDFVSLGSEHACREAGKLYIEGKDYIVQDGDILYIRFNV